MKITKLLLWLIKWLIVIKHLPKVCYQEVKIWISKRKEKSLSQIEDNFNRKVEEEVSRISTPEKIVIVDNIGEYLNKNEANPIILTGDIYRVRRIDNEEGAVFFGKDRGWCTSETPCVYRSAYSKQKGDLFIIYKLKKKNPEAQLFVSKQGSIQFKLKYNGYANWLEFKNQDLKLSDWWEIYYPEFLKSFPKSIEISSSIVVPESAGISHIDIATLALLGGQGGGYGGGVYGNVRGLFGGGIAAQAHADGSGLLAQADHARHQVEMARDSAQEALRSAQMNDQRIALNNARIRVQDQPEPLLRYDAP